MQAAVDVLRPHGYRLLQYDFPDAVFLQDAYIEAFPCVPWLAADDYRAAYRAAWHLPRRASSDDPPLSSASTAVRPDAFERHHRRH